MSAMPDPLLAELLRKEGGYVDHPDDRGGPTNFGITEAVARAAGWQGSMRDLPRDLALGIYRHRYWTAPRLDAVAAIAPMLAADLFDIAVNMGPTVAAGFLQRLLNALNRQGRDWADIAVDSVIGAATLDALRALLARRPAGETILRRGLNALKGARYIELAEARQANESFLAGWLAQRVT